MSYRIAAEHVCEGDVFTFPRFPRAWVIGEDGDGRFNAASGHEKFIRIDGFTASLGVNAAIIIYREGPRNVIQETLSLVTIPAGDFYVALKFGWLQLRSPRDTALPEQRFCVNCGEDITHRAVSNVWVHDSSGFITCNDSKGSAVPAPLGARRDGK